MLHFPMKQFIKNVVFPDHENSKLLVTVSFEFFYYIVFVYSIFDIKQSLCKWRFIL